MALLLLAYILNFIDRQIAGILAGPSSMTLGSRILSSAGSAAPPSRFSIRSSRSRLRAMPTGRPEHRPDRGLALWSLAHRDLRPGLELLATLSVRNGESALARPAGVAPAYSLLTDLLSGRNAAPARWRIFSLGIPLGSSRSGRVFGGIIAAMRSTGAPPSLRSWGSRVCCSRRSA